jgi:F-type H+-transporting ATPase subunit delta
LVTRKEREVYLENICGHFAILYKKHKNIITIEITTAYPIDDEIRKKIIDLLEEIQHKEVELVEKIDETIIGGVVLKLDDRKFDASLRMQLIRLRKVFDKNLYVKGY